MADEGAVGVEKPQDFRTSVARWHAEMLTAEKQMDEWHKQSRAIVERYTLEDSTQHVGDDDGGDYETMGKFNILWSNVQTLMPGVYGREPIPVVKRRYRDADPVGRIASEILERAIKTDLESDERRGKSLDTALKQAALDVTLTARGVLWQRYEPDLEGDTVLSESAPVDFLTMDEFLHAPLQNWAEVSRRGWVARKVDMTREEGVRRFGDIFRKVPLNKDASGYRQDTASSGMTDMVEETIARSSVWELWDAKTKRVYWFNRSFQEKMLDEKPDPLHLDGFFPCPPPAYGTCGNGKLVPTPDYLQYSRLAQELDEQTKQIELLTSELRLAGFYDTNVDQIGNLLEQYRGKNFLIGIPGLMGQVGSSGGTLSNVVQYLPLETVAKALSALYAARAETRETIDEVMGISDIQRGRLGNRYEKLGQSQIKAQHGGQRIDSRRRAIEHLARDVLRLKAEIIAEHYSPDTLRQTSGFDRMPEVLRLKRALTAQAEAEAQQTGIPPSPLAIEQALEGVFARAIELLKSERMRGFIIEVETNSTVLPNEEEDKARRNEFLEATGNLLERGLQVVERAPQMGSLIGELILYGARGYRAGRQLESALEEAVEQMRDAPSQPPPDPAQEAKVQAEQAKSQAVQAQAQADMQKIAVQTQADMMANQAKLREIQAQMASDEKKAEIEAFLANVDFQAKLAELDIEQGKLDLERQALRQKALDTAAQGSKE